MSERMSRKFVRGLIEGRYKPVARVDSSPFAQRAIAIDIQNNWKKVLLSKIHAFEDSYYKYKDRTLNSDILKSLRTLEALPQLFPTIEVSKTFRTVGDGRMIIITPHGSSTPLLSHTEKTSTTLKDKLQGLLEISKLLGSLHHCGFIFANLTPQYFEVAPSGKLLFTGIEALRYIRDGSRVISYDISSYQYSPPERQSNLRPQLSPRKRTTHVELDLTIESDIYSFGIIAYEVLSSKHPFRNVPNPLQALAHVAFDPPFLHDDLASMPRKGRELVERCIEKDPSRRIKSMSEIGSIISGCLEEPSLDASTAQRSGHNEKALTTNFLKVPLLSEYLELRQVRNRIGDSRLPLSLIRSLKANLSRSIASESSIKRC